MILRAAFFALLLAAGARPESPGLYDQAVARVLGERFESERISYLLLDAQSSAPLAAKWENVDAAVPVGSLMKPFIALAWARAHGFAYPEFTCGGAANGCWLPHGHGRVGLESAIANSCNVYFRELANCLRKE